MLIFINFLPFGVDISVQEGFTVHEFDLVDEVAREKGGDAQHIHGGHEEVSIIPFAPRLQALFFKILCVFGIGAVKVGNLAAPKVLSFFLESLFKARTIFGLIVYDHARRVHDAAIGTGEPVVDIVVVLITYEAEVVKVDAGVTTEIYADIACQS